MYVGRTQLYQVSTGTVIDQWPSFVRTRAGVMANLHPATRTTVLATPGDYEVRYRLGCVYQVRVVGLHRDVGHLVLEYSVWRTRASQAAGDPPDLVNTHSFQIVPGMLSGMTALQKRAWFRQHIEAFLLRASHRDLTGNRRDARLPLLDAATTQAILDPDLVALDGSDTELVP